MNFVIYARNATGSVSQWTTPERLARDVENILKQTDYGYVTVRHDGRRKVRRAGPGGGSENERD